MSRARRDIAPDAPDGALFSSYFDRLPEPAYVWRSERGALSVVAANRAARDRAGGADLAGLGVEALFPEHGEIGAELGACIEAGHVRECECELEADGADARRLSLTFVPVGEGLAVMHERDVTEEHRSREALAESERHVRALIRSNPELLVRVSGDGRILELHAPPDASAFLPMDPDECVGRYIDELYDSAFAAQHAYYRGKVLADGSVQFWQYSRRMADGLLNLEARFVRSGDDEVLVTVRDVGQHVQREREIVLSVERERNRIGQELHDGLAQLLTGANLLLEPIKEPFSTAQPEQGENFYQAVDLVKQAIAQTRELARGLSPVPQGGGFSLRDALAELAQQSQDYYGLTCLCECRGPLPELSAETAANLYRIAQEAVTNAVKHGGARHVDIVYSVVEGRFELQITDDGRGIGLDESLSAASGMGLSIMRYRARAIGAELAIGPGGEGGTVVQCTVTGPRCVHRDAADDGARHA